MCTKNPFKLLTILFAFVACMPAFAGDVWLTTSRSGNYKAIVIEGEIASGDFDSFRRIAKAGKGRVSGVYIFSPGGDFDEAMKIGKAIRALELTTNVPMKDDNGKPYCEEDSLGVTPSPKLSENCVCASAGFFIHIGGVSRGGTYLAVHRPYFGKGKFGELTQDKAKNVYDNLLKRARSYMEEMAVPRHVQEDVLGTPSDKLLLLDDKTVKTYFWASAPYRYEWLRNKCAMLTEEESLRMKRYAELLRAAMHRSPGSINSYSDIGFTDSEWGELEQFRKKEDEGRKCETQVIEQSRISAYRKYFGMK